MTLKVKTIAPFGKLRAQDQRQFCLQDEAKNTEAAFEAIRSWLCRQLSSCPNVYRRRASLRGLLRGTINAFGPAAVDGTSLDGGLKELDALESEVHEIFQTLRREYAARRRTIHGAPKVFDIKSVDVEPLS